VVKRADGPVSVKSALTCVDTLAFKTSSRNPEMYAVIDDDYRRALVRRMHYDQRESIGA